MKKKIVGIILGGMIAGAAATNVSAAEYEVQKGDSLWYIAEEHDTTVDTLVKVNQLDTKVIQPKQKLIINKTYIVERGDTLSHIANTFDVTVEEIKGWNKLDSSLLTIGQELDIYATNKEKQKKDKAVHTSANETAATPAVTKQRQGEKAETSTATEEKAGKTIAVTATAYTAKCTGCSGVTATGVDLNSNPNAKVIAVDPAVIPLGTKVHVEGYGEAVAADTGGAIKGNKIDIHVPTKDQAYSWGVRDVNVTILD